MCENSDRILRSNKSVVEIPFNTVGEYVWNGLQLLNKESVCLIDAITDEHLTIGELIRQSNNIAIALINRGITKTDRIAFYGQNSIQHSILRFATYFLGITFVPLSPTFGGHEVQEEVIFTKSNVIFCSEKEFYKFNAILDNSNEYNVKLVLIFDGNHEKYLTFERLLSEGKDKTLAKIPYFNVSPETDMFFLVHTSGTSGKPKCAMIPHRVILNSVVNSNPTASISVIIAMVYPFGHMSGTSLLPLQITSGATLVLFAEFNEELLYRSIEKYRISFVPTFAYFGKKLIESGLADNYDLSSVKMMSTGGAAFPANIAKAIIDKYKVIFTEVYGITENLTVSTGAEFGEEFISGNLGRVAPGNEVKIVDLNTGQSLGPNIDGEICIRGNILFVGYLNDHKSTNEVFDRNGWFRTGDIGHYDEMERLYITDRIREIIDIGVDNRYVQIYPTEIEQFLLTHKSIAEVAVIGVPNTTYTQSPRAYVVLKQFYRQSVTEEEIKTYVSDTLSYTKHLTGGVVFVDEIKRTGMGKVDRKYYRNLVNNEVID